MGVKEVYSTFRNLTLVAVRFFAKKFVIRRSLQTIPSLSLIKRRK